MTSIELYKTYADVHCYDSWKTVWHEHEKGLISNRDLFDAWLIYEGIIGYTDKIIQAYKKSFQ